MEYSVLGIKVGDFEKKELLKRIATHLSAPLSAKPQPKFIVAINPEKIMYARKNSVLKNYVNSCDFKILDGVGIKYAVVLLYGKYLHRITGVSLFEKLLNLAQRYGLSIGVATRRQEVFDLFQKKIAAQLPRVTIAGNLIYNDNANFEKDSAAFLAKSYDIVIVAMGSPLQEQWIIQNKAQIKSKIVIGVGGSLDVYTDYVPKTPNWIVYIGFEWLYRVLYQPRLRIKRIANVFKFGFIVLGSLGRGRNT